ncbi:MAG: magnesium transporter [Bacteroidia bacterium]|nr:magnesium transporter [Bacteroidia bacterium]
MNILVYLQAMSFVLSDEIILNWKNLISEKNSQALKAEMNELFSADIARVMNQLSDEENQFVFQLLDEEARSEVLAELDEDKREFLLESLSTEQIADVLDNLDSDDAADIVSELPEEKQQEVLSQIEDVEQASDIAELIRYEEGTAGSLMAKELVSVYTFETVNQCIDEIRRQADDVTQLYAVYVVDNHERLKGIIPLKKLLISHPLARVEEIYESDIQFVRVDDSLQLVSETMSRYDLVVLPVVDKVGKLVGKITIDDVLDYLKEKSEEDIQRMSGITEDIDVQDKIWKISQARIPWLLIGMGGGIIGSRIIGNYEEHIRIRPEMAFFIPLIGATGGNVGVQSSSIMVQALANNMMFSNVAKKLLKELYVGLFNGLICSSLIFLYAMVAESWKLGLVVSIALFTVIIFASFMGTFVPMTLHRFKINPALATGPFVTTLNDIIGITIYFLVGRILYSMF